jgi:NADH dehydrogenase FAD-containing subunit
MLLNQIQKVQSILIIGGGPTGCEIAGETAIVKPGFETRIKMV